MKGVRHDRPVVLVIEDDPPIRDALEIALRSEGYEVHTSADGADVLELAEKLQPHLAILDVRLPVGPDGYTLARVLRQTGDTAVLFLTAADGLQDRLLGFEAGADDYMVKPFPMAELLARARALLRRSAGFSSGRLEFEDLALDEGSRSVTRGGQEVELTRTEYELLRALMQHPRQVLSKHQLLAQVWGFDSYDPNVVEVHMSALRRKLEVNALPRLVHTLRGQGYVLRSP